MKKKDNSQEIMISDSFSSKLIIDLKALRENYQKIVEFVHPATVSAVVKANAYGLGVQKVAEQLLSTSKMQVKLEGHVQHLLLQLLN